MFTLKSKLSALLAALLCAGTAFAQDNSALLDLLVKKGIINNQESKDLRAELAKNYAGTSAGKLSVAGPLKELKIFGDLRVRYENRTGELPTGDDSRRDRYRYRFRTGLTGTLADNWSWGFRLETGSGNRSSNGTMADDGGPWAKTNDGIFLGQLWTKWSPTPEFALTAGRMPNPLVATSMVWDGDINPEGLAEQFKRKVGQVEYSATAAQFLYSTSGTQNPYGTGARVNDLFLLAWQGGVKYFPGKSSSQFFQANPTIYNYLNNGPLNPAPFKGSFSATSATAVNNVFVFDLPLEYDWVSNGVPMRLFGDFAVNLDGDQRAAKWGRPDLDGENKAWQIGYQYGKAAKKGEWTAKAFYQSVGAFALDANLVDSDLFDSRTNMQGWVFSTDYNLGAATVFTLTLANGQRANDSLVAPGSGDIGSNNALDKFWLLQADLVVKF